MAGCYDFKTASDVSELVPRAGGMRKCHFTCTEQCRRQTERRNEPGSDCSLGLADLLTQRQALQLMQQPRLSIDQPGKSCSQIYASTSIGYKMQAWHSGYLQGSAVPKSSSRALLVDRLDSSINSNSNSQQQLLLERDALLVLLLLL